MRDRDRPARRSSGDQEIRSGCWPSSRKALGLDHSIVVQWWDWLKGFVHGDLGTSSRTQDSVSSMIRHALWPTVQLLFWATIVSVIVALLLGVYSSVKQYSTGDYFFTGAVVRRDRDARLLVRAARDRRSS